MGDRGRIKGEARALRARPLELGRELNHELYYKNCLFTSLSHHKTNLNSQLTIFTYAVSLWSGEALGSTNTIWSLKDKCNMKRFLGNL